MERQQKVLLVTGASRGIGAEIARLAARVNESHWAVAVNYARSAVQAKDVVNQITAQGGTAIAVQADVGEEDQVASMFERIDQELGPVTGLVNNAGVDGAGVRVDDLDVDVSMNLFRVNVLGAFLCAKHAIRRMARRHGGHGGVIVNVSSAASIHGGPFTYIDYAASKGAIDTFTTGLSKEQAAQGIRVNTLRPGATMTEMSVTWAQEHPEWLEWVMAQVPLSRPAEMSEIAQAALFLLSEQSAYVSGAVLDVSGGWVSP